MVEAFLFSLSKHFFSDTLCNYRGSLAEEGLIVRKDIGYGFFEKE